jgi:hypothetical protein
MRLLITTILSSAVLFFSAVSASAFATTINSTSAGGNVDIGDIIEVTMTFDTEGEIDVTLISVGLLFDDAVWTYRDDLFFAATYALYGAAKSNYFVPASTNGELRVGVDFQANGDWLSSGIPDGTDTAGSFDMGAFYFEAVAEDETLFEICGDCPGNVLQLGDGSTPPNNISGDFIVTVPEASAVGLSAAALLTLAMIRTRSRHQ